MTKNSIEKRLTQKVLEFLKQQPNRTFRARELSRHLGVTARDYRTFRQLLKSLVAEEKVIRQKGGLYGCYVAPDRVSGVLQVKPQGYGFLVRKDGGQDLFISQKNMKSAMNGDTVEAEIWAQSKGRLPEGKVRHVLERKRKRVVGLFMEANKYNYVIPDDFKLTRDLYVGEADRHEARPGQKVVVEIDDWGDAGRMPVGHVVEVLGYPDDPGVDVLSVASEFEIQQSFSDQIEEEAQKISSEIMDEEIVRRLDLRDAFIFTIDPEDAKDFDDAISIRPLENGHVQVGVHIADVSHYVRPQSVIDREALHRGTSVYLVDRVIPMLPERLSNQLCSLRPGEDRLAFSVLFEMTLDGEVIRYQLHESLINSKFRLNYQQAHEMLTDQYEIESFSAETGKSTGDVKTLFESLKQLHQISQHLLARWRGQGSIDFGVSEATVRLDEQGKPVALGVYPRHESHRMIEALMLLANQSVTEFVNAKRESSGMKLPFIYRVHEKPSAEKLERFTKFVRAFGYAFSPGKTLLPKKLQQFMQEITNPAHKTVIDVVAIRTMMKAVYTTENTGHFGLAFENYTHFTSPIRRYPDLVVHRLLKAYLQTPPRKPEIKPTLAQIAESCTASEINAQEAERESIRAKQVEYMARHLGDEFDGIISGVAQFGIYVEIPEFMVEGLVAVRDLEDDYYQYDENRMRLVGERTNRVFRLGDSVQVRLARVHREMRKLDFVLTDTCMTGRSVKPKKKRRTR